MMVLTLGRLPEKEAPLDRAAGDLYELWAGEVAEFVSRASKDTTGPGVLALLL